MNKNETTIIRFPALKKKLGNISRSTIGRWEHSESMAFPRRISLGPNSVGWRLDLVDKWLQERSNAIQQEC